MRLSSLCLAAVLGALAGCATQPVPTAPQPMPATAARAPGKTEVLWVGHATVRIVTPGGKVVVIDPWLGGNPRAPANFKTPESLGKVDLVLVTHAHPDHYTDAPAVARLNNAKMVVPSDFGVTLAAHGLVAPELLVRLHKGGTYLPFGDSGIKVTAVRAEHSSMMRMRNPTTNREEVFPGGEPMGYIVEMENGFKLWHTGDTAVFSDMALIGRLHQPDLVMASIDGYFTMSPREAGYAMREMVKPKFVVPIHYGTLVEMRGTPAQLQEALGSGPGAPQMIVVQPGQKLDF